MIKLLIILFILLILCGLPWKTDITHYTLKSSKIRTPVRFAVISDLHNERYGKDMRKLKEMIDREHPDLILMPGDILGDYAEYNAVKLFRQIREYPCIYVTGNHEIYLKPERTQAFLQKVRDAGITILDHESCLYTKGDTTIEIGGIHCHTEEEPYTPQEITNVFHTGSYRIFLTHRPHWAEIYKDADCDLVVTGHAHGGQVRIPFTDIGIIAPQQGFFPHWIRGIHDLGQVKLLISRGLVRHYHRIPRLYNNPELVIFTLEPENNV